MPPGVFTSQDLVDRGLGPQDVQRCLRNGSWTRLRRGAYVETAVWDSADELERHALACAALVAVSAADLVVSHSSAALLLGVPLLVPPVHPSVTRPRPPGSAALHLPSSRSSRLDSPETTVVRGLRLTDLCRTTADLARTLEPPAAAVAVDGALHLGLERQELHHALDGMTGWPGAAAARAVVEAAEPLSESALETLTRLRVLAHGFPAPVAQLVVRDRSGAFLGRVDLAWPAQRVALEADGRGKYLRPEDLWAEKRREDALRDAGWEVVRAYWADARDGGAALADRLRRAFARSARAA